MMAVAQKCNLTLLPLPCEKLAFPPSPFNLSARCSRKIIISFDDASFSHLYVFNLLYSVYSYFSQDHFVKIFIICAATVKLNLT